MSDAITVSLALARRLYSGEAITTAIIRTEYGVSAATAKRYMNRIAAHLPVVVEIVPTEAGGGKGQPRKQIRLQQAS